MTTIKRIKDLYPSPISNNIFLDLYKIDNQIFSNVISSEEETLSIGIEYVYNHAYNLKLSPLLMKLLSVQMAIFSEESISRPDLLFNEVNEKLGGLINDMPTIINLPPDIPAEIPVVQAKSTDGRINLNVSRSRIDLIANFIYESEQSPLEALNSQKETIQKFYKSVLNSITANRTGFILTLFEPSTNNVKSVFEKYFSEKYTSKFVEASTRVNKQNMRKSVVYNNIRLVEAATITVGAENIPGVLFQLDINNALEPGKRINEDIVSYVVSQGVSNLSPEAVKEMI